MLEVSGMDKQSGEVLEVHVFKNNAAFTSDGLKYTYSKTMRLSLLMDLGHEFVKEVQ
jgi:hypothetical protein